MILGAPKQIRAVSNETFSRVAYIKMPGYELPPLGKFLLEFRKTPGVDVALSFSSDAGNARVIAYNSTTEIVSLALLASAQMMAVLSGKYNGDLVYVADHEVENLGSFAMIVGRGISQPSLPSPPPYDDIGSWGPLEDLA